jgi:tetratricopeptide (TPR) repeat protein
VVQRVQGWRALSTDDIAEAIRLARQALEAARDDPETVWRAAYPLFLLAGETALAETVVDRALTQNPNAATAWMFRGLVHALRNRPEAAIEACERAQRLSPFDPLRHWIAVGIALAHLYSRRFDQAIEWADRALHDQPRLVTAFRTKAVAKAYLGRLDEARAELGRMLAIDTGLTIAGYRALLGPAVAPEALDLVVAGLRLAGLPGE